MTERWNRLEIMRFGVAVDGRVMRPKTEGAAGGHYRPTVDARRGQLQVDFNFARRRRTADQQVPGGWRLQRIGLIVDSSADQRAFAGMADARTARPLHGHIASFRKFQQAGEPGIPRNREPASRKRNLRAGAGFSRGRVSRRVRSWRNTRRDRRLRPKHLLMNSCGIDAPCFQARSQVAEE